MPPPWRACSRSWLQFDDYMTCNIQATQHLLDAAVKAGVRHYLHCSTSSVYGRFATGNETSALAPVSPYGITKLAAEQLVQAYGQKDGLNWTILRLYSVYGPRQRPDMGYNIFIRKLLTGEEIVVDGDGTDSRSNTYVMDCVRGLMLAAGQPAQSAGQIFNIGGGEEVNVNQVLAMLEELTGETAHVRHGPARPGDQRRTVADTDQGARCARVHGPHGGAGRPACPGGVAACGDGRLAIRRTPPDYAARRSVTVTTLGSTSTVPSGNTRVGTRGRPGARWRRSS